MSIPHRTYSGRVVAVDDIAPGTRRLSVEIDNRRRLPFAAGQYVQLSLAGFEERPFSIASAPHDPLLEFHVKSSGRGLSAHIVEALQPGHAVTLRGPFGLGHWRDDGRPLLALGGGMGIAPLKSIIDACLRQARPQPPVHLYWGVRGREQLYLDGYFRALAGRHPGFSYVPVLSDEDGGERRGFAGSAAAADFDTLAGLSIYLAGPRAMVDAALPLLLQKGAEESHIFSDSLTP